LRRSSVFFAESKLKIQPKIIPLKEKIRYIRAVFFIPIPKRADHFSKTKASKYFAKSLPLDWTSKSHCFF
jgi:hypothetical protein